METEGDNGQCFLNAFTLFLNGKHDPEIGFRLRIAMALEMINNADFHSQSVIKPKNDEELLQYIKKDISQNKYLEYVWGTIFMNFSDIISYILKRHIVLIENKIFYEKEINGVTYECSFFGNGFFLNYYDRCTNKWMKVKEKNHNFRRDLDLKELKKEILHTGKKKRVIRYTRSRSYSILKEIKSPGTKKIKRKMNIKK